MDKIYDLIIVGSGPAGFSASLYASRYKLDHLIFGTENGGQMNEIHTIENWPGEISISGSDLVGKFKSHIENYGVSVVHESVSSIEKNKENIFLVKTSAGDYLSRALVLAMGAEYRKINIPGEKEFTGKGVSYCATCDAPFFKDKVVSVVGGGNSAVVVALELSDYARKTYLVHQGDRLNAEPAWIEKIINHPKIEIIKETGVVEISGNGKVEKIVLDRIWNDKNHLEVDGVFIEVGSDPGVYLAKKMGVATDDGNYIKVKKDMSTNVKGIFAAGDITTGSNKFRQVLTACAEGAIAANSVYKLLKL